MTERPRIALYLHHLNIGGAERVMVELARGFVEAGLRVDFVLVQAKGTLLSQIPSGARVFDLHAFNAYMGIPALSTYLHREAPHTLLATSALTGLTALFTRRSFGPNYRVLVILATTISRTERNPLKKWVERVSVSRLYSQADEIVAVSRGVRDDFVRYTGMSAGHVKLIYNPVITTRLQAEAGGLVDHPFFQSGQPPVILGVGRLTAPKNFPSLIRAFALVRRHKPARLLILGDGEERPKLAALVRSLELDGEVSLPGFVASPFAYMSKSSVFVLSSLREGLPGALIEALACGCPVVSTDCQSGPSEILDGGRYGHLVPVDDVEALAREIEACLNGDHRKPPAAWLEQFRADRIINQYLELMGLS